MRDKGALVVRMCLASMVPGSCKPDSCRQRCTRVCILSETVTVRLTMREDVKASALSVIDCSQVGASRLAAMTGTLQLGNRGIAALKPGDFGGLGGLTVVVLSGNALGALPERVLEPLTGLTALDLSRNPGSAGFLPRADAGADHTVSAGKTVTLGGPGTGRGPWGTNADYRWVEVGVDGNEVAAAARTQGLSGESAREARFTAPALAEERVLRYRLAVQGRGGDGLDRFGAACRDRLAGRLDRARRACAVLRRHPARLHGAGGAEGGRTGPAFRAGGAPSLRRGQSAGAALAGGWLSHRLRGPCDPRSLRRRKIDYYM